MMMRKLSLIALAFALVFSVASGASATPVITSGLVAAWEFSGNANDVSGNGNNGVVNGATLTSDRSGNPNSAYSFDGVDDSILIGTQFNNFSDYTQSAWVNFPSESSADSAPFIVQMAGGFFNYYRPGGEIHIRMVVDRVGGITSNPHASYYYQAPVSIQGDAWTHIAVTVHSDNTAELYVNGNAIDVGTRLFDGGGVGDVPETVIGVRHTPNKNPPLAFPAKGL